MRVRLSRGFVLDGVTYPARLEGVEIPNKVSRINKKGVQSLWPVVAFEGWKDGDQTVPLPGDAMILDDEDAAEVEARNTREAYVKRQEPVVSLPHQEPVALSQLSKSDVAAKVGGKVV